MMRRANAAVFAPAMFSVPFSKRRGAQQGSRSVSGRFLASNTTAEIEAFDRFGNRNPAQAQDRVHQILRTYGRFDPPHTFAGGLRPMEKQRDANTFVVRFLFFV